MLAREYQLFSLNLLTFPASGYLDKVPAPTDENIRNQFDMFKDEQPGSYGSNRNPLGFGYKTPNRAKVQFIEIVADEVRHAAEKSKSKTDWGVEAYTQFKAHRDYFDSLPVPCRPALSLRPGPRLRSPFCPAPHKLDDVDKDFALHANVVLQKLYEQQAYHIEDEAQKKIVEALTTGFGAYRSAQSLLAATTSPSTQPSTQPAALPVVKDPPASTSPMHSSKTSQNLFKLSSDSCRALSMATDLGTRSINSPRCNLLATPSTCFPTARNSPSPNTLCSSARYWMRQLNARRWPWRRGSRPARSSIG